MHVRKNRERVEIRGIPIEKWRGKGGEFFFSFFFFFGHFSLDVLFFSFFF